MKKVLPLQIYTALLLVSWGVLVMFAWPAGIRAVVQPFAPLAAIPFNAALCFTLLGLGLLVPLSRARRVSAICRTLGLLVAAIGLINLVEILFDLPPLIDLRSLHAWLADGNPRPGRMAPGTSIGFILAGTTLALTYSAAHRSVGWLIKTGILSVLGLGMLGLVGYSLRLDYFYGWGHLSRMAVPTAVGLMVTALGLWQNRLQAPHRASLFRTTDEERIGFIASATLALIALTTGVAGFSAQQHNLEISLTSRLSGAFLQRVTVFKLATQQKIDDARALAVRPDLIRFTRQLAANPANAQARREMALIADSMKLAGVTGMLLHDAAQRPLFHSGSVFSEPPIRALLDQSTASELLWDKAYFLRSTIDIMDRGSVVGTLLVQQALPTLDHLFSRVDGFGETGEIGMCVPGKDLGPDNFACFPQLRNNALYEVSGRTGNGGMTQMAQAIAGRSGVYRGHDYRGNSVIGIYGPLTGNGLGMAAKQNTAEVYTPIRQQAQVALPMLLLFVAAGSWLLRSQVRPLVAKLTHSERAARDSEARVRAIVDNVAEGVITINRHGTIESFNAAAADIFGYSVEEALGMNLQRLMPPEMRGPHMAGMRRLMAGEMSQMIGQKGIELRGLRKDGTAFMLELAVSSIEIDDKPFFIGVVRDITERKKAEQQLAYSEQRLRTITNNLPVIITYIDRQHRLQFCNATFEQWIGVAPQDVIDHHFAEVLGEILYSSRKNYLETALEGQRVDFEMTVQAQGVHRRLQVTYIPDRTEEGLVQGVYALATDITALKEAEHKMSMLARHDALTGLPNRYQINEKLDEAVSRSQRSRMPLALLFLDIDHFKSINDSRGHAAGDEVLKQFAARLLACVRVTDTVARLAGDEFVIILESLHSTEEAALVAGKILTSIATEWQIAGAPMEISTSIGVAFCESRSHSAADLLAIADRALYAAKHSGRNRFKVEVC